VARLELQGQAQANADRITALEHSLSSIKAALQRHMTGSHAGSDSDSGSKRPGSSSSDHHKGVPTATAVATSTALGVSVSGAGPGQGSSQLLAVTTTRGFLQDPTGVATSPIHENENAAKEATRMCAARVII
jgi:hypothetical protein